MDVTVSHDGSEGILGTGSSSSSSSSPPCPQPGSPGVAGSTFPFASSAFAPSPSAPTASGPGVSGGVPASSPPTSAPSTISPCPCSPPRPANGPGMAPLTTPVSKVGYVLYNERLGGSDTILWSDGVFFRLASAPKPFKPFTPVAFTSTYSVGLPIGRFSVPSYSAVFAGVIYDGPGAPPPFAKGSFSKRAFGKVQFTFNPSSVLALPVHFTLAASSFPSIPLDTEVLVQFAVRPPRFSSDPPYPFVKGFRVPQGVPFSIVEPSTNVLPLSFLRDMHENPSFSFLLGIGIQENDFFPSLSFSEFCSFKEGGPIIWKRLIDILLGKYKKLSSLEGDRKEVYTSFYNRLVKNHSNQNKGVLIYSGSWQNFSGLSLALSLLPSTRLSLFVLDFAHPLTTASNVSELNPHFSGFIQGNHIVSSYFFTSPVYVGETGIDNEMHFGFAHNAHHFILSKVGSSSPPQDGSMFRPVSHVPLKHYSPPEVKGTGSEVNDRSLLASFPKGSDGLNKVRESGLFFSKVPDLSGAWSAFDVFQLFSPYSSSDVSFDSFLSACSKAKRSFHGKVLCDDLFVSTPCSSSNRLRVLKLGSIKSIHALRWRSFPVFLLQKLGLIDQALPLSNFYFKVRLLEGVSDSLLFSKLQAVNKAVKDVLFHSFFDGDVTTSLVVARARVGQASTEGVLVIDRLPLGLKVDQVSGWLSSFPGIVGPRVRWGEGPLGSSLLIECTLSAPPPAEFPFNGRSFPVRSFSSLPSEYKYSTSVSSLERSLSKFASSEFDLAGCPLDFDRLVSGLTGPFPDPSPSSSSSSPAPSSAPSSSSSPSSDPSPPSSAPSASSPVSPDSSSSVPGPSPLPFSSPSFPPPPSPPSPPAGPLSQVSSKRSSRGEEVKSGKRSSSSLPSPPGSPRPARPKRASRPLPPHQVAGEDVDPSSDYSPTPSQDDEVRRAWVRPKKKSMERRKERSPPSADPPLSNSFSSLSPDSLD